MQGEYKLSDEQSPPTSNDLLGLHLRFDDVWFRAVYKCDHLVTFSLKGLAGRRIVKERTITPQSVRVEVSRRDNRNLRGRGLAQRLKWRVGIGAIDRVERIVGIDFVERVKGIVRVDLIDRIRRIAGIDAVDRVERIPGINGIDGIQRIIRPVLIDWTKDVVVALIISQRIRVRQALERRRGRDRGAKPSTWRASDKRNNQWTQPTPRLEKSASGSEKVSHTSFPLPGDCPIARCKASQ